MSIDAATFAELHDSVGDEFATELVDTFLEEAPGILADLRAALAATDTDAYRRAAQSLKSNGNTLGALAFASMARQAELSGFTGDAAIDNSVLAALEAAYNTAADELKALCHG